MRRLGEVGVELELECVMQMSEGLLLRNDRDVVLGGVGDEVAHVVTAHCAAGRGDHRLRGEGQRVLEVQRERVDLEGGEEAHLALLILERGQRAAREIVLHAAPAHRGPVANHRRCEARAAAINELLECLESVEHASGAVADDGGAVVGGDEDVALILHCGVEGEVALGKQAARCVAGRAEERDVPAAIGGGDVSGESALAHCGGEVERGVSVGGVGAGRDGDFAADRHGRRRADDLAGCRQERGRGCGLGAERGRRENEKRGQHAGGRGEAHRGNVMIAVGRTLCGRVGNE